jgi:hypothetical protein
MEKTKCIWTVGLGEEDSRYITKRLVFLLLGWMDGWLLLGGGYTNVLRIAVATTFFTPCTE